MPRRCAALLVLAVAAASAESTGDLLVPPAMAAGAGATQEPGPPPEPFFAWTGPAFPTEELAGRRARLAERLRLQGGGTLLVPSRPGRSGGDTFRQLDDFLYLTGLELPDSVLTLDDSGETTLFVPVDDARFVNPSRRNDFPGRPLAKDPELAWRSGVERVRPVTELEDHLAGLAAGGGVAWVPGATTPAPGSVSPISAGATGESPPAGGAAVEPIGAPAPRDPGAVEAFVEDIRSRFPTLALRDARPQIAPLRMVKSPREVERLRRAAAVTEDAIRRAARAIRPGVDERTLQGEFEAGCRAGGAQRIPFTPIVKSGPNSLWPWRVLAAHYDRRNRAMAAGDLVILDVGCEVDYYVSDVGRTFPVGGAFTAPQAEILAMEVAVADAILAAIEPGTTFAALQETAAAAIPEEHRRYMQTGLFFGHHIGMSSGDPSRAAAPLEPGMVFTVEPWYYNHDLGIAVFTEDVVLVTTDGAERLSASLPRGAADLAALVGAR